MSEISDNRRIAKNTLYLYARMLLIMLVGLYTVRIVLDVLGAEDYGIYTVVGGVIAMFSFLTNAMVSASQRYFAYYIGKNDKEKLRQYFVITCLCYLSIGAIVVLLSETVGLWFVKTKLTIPESRMSAALIVYHCTIASFVLRLFVIPHESFIIAKERMNVYAYISIVEVVLKLLIVFLLLAIDVDHLALYGVLHLLTCIVVSAWYIGYSRYHFKETKLYKYYNKKQFFDLLSYSGWNLFGSFSSVCRSQGINILLNMFFSPAVNAARAVAYQINTAITTFANNFFSAVKPQITKQFAAGEESNMMNLVFRSSRFCYYILLFLALPVLLEVPTILKLWLKEVPEYTVLFARLVIINALVDSMASPLMTAIQATGRIKYYQIVTAGLLLLNIPVSYIFLRLGFAPHVTMIISICISILAQISRVAFAHSLLAMKALKYVEGVLIPIGAVTIASSLLPLILKSTMPDTQISFFVVCGVSCFTVGCSSFLLGATKSERAFILNGIKNRIHSNENRN